MARGWESAIVSHLEGPVQNDLQWLKTGKTPVLRTAPGTSPLPLASLPHTQGALGEILSLSCKVGHHLSHVVVRAETIRRAEART